MVQHRIWFLGKNIDTDLIVPPQYLTARDPSVQTKHALESLLPNFSAEVRVGDIIVADTNFGCGSSREEAVFVLKELGIRVIIASSFARIFYRNCFNLGIPAIILPDAVSKLKDKQIIDIQLDKGTIILPDGVLYFKEIPSFLLEMIEAGGALELLKKKKNLQNSM